MAQRVIVRNNLVRISKPGFDVMSAAEKDLLISLGVRSGQIIQRGFVAIPPQSGTNYSPSPNPYTAPNDGLADFTMTVTFPTQQAIPDVWPALLSASNYDGNSSGGWSYGMATRSFNLTTSSLTCTLRDYSTPDKSSFRYKGLNYVIFRKRLDG